MLSRRWQTVLTALNKYSASGIGEDAFVALMEEGEHNNIRFCRQALNEMYFHTGDGPYWEYVDATAPATVRRIRITEAGRKAAGLT